jgi:hypothetical protein
MVVTTQQNPVANNQNHTQGQPQGVGNIFKQETGKQATLADRVSKEAVQKMGKENLNILHSPVRQIEATDHSFDPYNPPKKIIDYITNHPNAKGYQFVPSVDKVRFVGTKVLSITKGGELINPDEKFLVLNLTENDFDDFFTPETLVENRSSDETVLEQVPEKIDRDGDRLDQEILPETTNAITPENTSTESLGTMGTIVFDRIPKLITPLQDIQPLEIHALPTLEEQKEIEVPIAELPTQPTVETVMQLEEKIQPVAPLPMSVIPEPIENISIQPEEIAPQEVFIKNNPNEAVKLQLLSDVMDRFSTKRSPSTPPVPANEKVQDFVVPIITPSEIISEQPELKQERVKLTLEPEIQKPLVAPVELPMETLENKVAPIIPIEQPIVTAKQVFETTYPLLLDYLGTVPPKNKVPSPVIKKDPHSYWNHDVTTDALTAHNV